MFIIAFFLCDESMLRQSIGGRVVPHSLTCLPRGYPVLLLHAVLIGSCFNSEQPERTPSLTRTGWVVATPVLGLLAAAGFRSPCLGPTPMSSAGSGRRRNYMPSFPTSEII